MNDDNGQKCGDCKGTGAKFQKTASLMPNGKMEETIVVSNCGSCLGSGWLRGRSQ